MARGNSTASNITNYKDKKLLFCSTDPRKEEHRRGTSRKKGDVSEAKRNLTEGHKPKQSKDDQPGRQVVLVRGVGLRSPAQPIRHYF